jgi:membrane protease YdiL (CAAX protease family)
MSVPGSSTHAHRGALALAVAVIAVWTAITIGGSMVAAGPDTPLDTLVSSTFMVPVLLAGAFMALVVQIKGWWGQMGRIAPRTASSLMLLWLPLVFIANFAFAAAGAPLPPAGVIGMVAVNTLMVGISEELAFRGMLWSQVRERLPFWPGFLLVSAPFGAVHVLNGLITGNWSGGAIQAFNAAVTGALFLALRIRTGSLLVVIVLHVLWDFMLFFASASDDPAGAAAAAPAGMMTELATIGIIAVPMGLYAMFLVRNARVRGNWREDSPPSSASAEMHSPAEDHR